MTDVTNDEFRAHYPEFSSPDKYPESALNYWFENARLLLPRRRWGRQFNIGTELFVAHNLAIEAQAQRTAAIGGVPGVSTGPINSKSVDGVSTGYDTASGLNPDAGHWNLTIYGNRFYRLMMSFGAAPLFVGVGYSPTNNVAWSGPKVDGNG